MKRLHNYSLVALLLLGLVLVAVGAEMWNNADYGITMTNWITPSLPIAGNGNMWTWGVAGIPTAEPDEWHFHVVFSANRTAKVALVWNLNESTLFEKIAATIDESFTVALPRTNVSWRWDWVIRNTDSSVVRVYNLTVTHYSITYPQRRVGLIALGCGFMAVLAAPIATVFLRRRDIRRQ